MALQQTSLDLFITTEWGDPVGLYCRWVCTPLGTFIYLSNNMIWNVELSWGKCSSFIFPDRPSAQYCSTKWTRLSYCLACANITARFDLKFNHIFHQSTMETTEPRSAYFILSCARARSAHSAWKEKVLVSCSQDILHLFSYFGTIFHKMTPILK